MEKNISQFIDNQFPKFVHEYGPKMVLFIKKYYEWLETVDNTLDTSRKLQEYMDVDQAPEKFWYFLKNEFLQGVPENHAAKKEILIKRIKDFYAAKGTEKSFEFIFRILFDEQVEFYYPAKDILRVSDGKWSVEKTLIIQPKAGIDIFSYLGKEVKGENSRAIGTAERIVSYILNGTITYEIFLSNIFNTFSVENIIDVQSKTVIGNCIEYKIYDGKYISNDGFLSDDKYIQDSYYYQEYSYELRSGQPISKYEDIVRETVHPSGTEFFGRFYLNRDFAINFASENDKILELEFEKTIPINLIVFSNLAFAGSGDFIDIFIDGFFSIFSDIENYVSRYFPRNGTVKILTDDNISSVSSYTIGQLQYVTLNDILNTKILLGNSTQFTSQFTTNDLQLYVNHINNDDMGFATVDIISSDVALTNKNKYSYTDIPNLDYIYKGISED